MRYVQVKVSTCVLYRPVRALCKGLLRSDFSYTAAVRKERRKLDYIVLIMHLMIVRER